MALVTDFDQLSKVSAICAQRERKIDWDLLPDKAKLWIPPNLSPLFHCPIYSKLSPEVRLGYNHFFSSMVLEQFILFERLGPVVVERYLDSQPVPESLRTYFSHMDREEIEHIEMFEKLKRQIEIEYPCMKGLNLFEIVGAQKIFLEFILKQSNHFPFLLWVLLFVEERSSLLVRRFDDLHRDDVDPLHYQVHVSHRMDEERHLPLAEKLIEKFWDPVSSTKKRYNTVALKYFFKNLFVDSYSAIKLWKLFVETLEVGEEFSPTVIQQLSVLSENRPYQTQLFSLDRSTRFFDSLSSRTETRRLRDYFRRISGVTL